VTRLPFQNLLLACLLLLASPALLLAQVQLKVGMEQNPPICSIDASGKPQGISVDILNEISRKEGWQISYVSCVWEQCLRDLVAEKLDMLLGIGHTAEREKLYDFSRETAVVNWAQVYTNKNIKAVSPIDLAGKRIALVPTDLHGSAFMDTMQRFSIDARIVRVESYGEALKAVINNTADAGVVSRIFPIAERENSKLLKTPIIFNPIHSKFAVPKGQHQQILQTIDRHLASMKSNKGSSYYRILENSLGVPGKAGIPGWVIGLLLGAAALLALMAIGNVLCRQRIRKRTKQLEHEVLCHQETSLALQHREEQLKTVIATTGEGYLLMDNQLTTVLDVNAAFCQLLGYQREEVLRTPPIHFVTKENHAVCRSQMTSFNSGDQRNYDMELLHRDGRIITVHCNTTKLPDEHDFGGNIFAFITDISERKQYEAQLQHQAHHDMLTGLPNRLLLYDRIEQAILHGQRHDTFLVLFLLDLDNFKVVNDTLGHSTGDQLLQAFSERTSAVLRQEDTFARLGGDEFVILPESISSNQDIVLVTQRIFNTLTTPFVIDGYVLSATTSWTEISASTS
jgi:diguanylate cyclase (GGDEF)-like protein/PAS domain S-box-containing protein